MLGKYLEINLKRLCAWDESLARILRESFNPNYPALRFTKDEQPIPVVLNKSLHSTYDPQSEALRWVQSLKLSGLQDSLLVVGGLGFGYHLTELAEAVSADRLLVVEPDAGLAAAALACRPPAAFPDGLQLIVEKSPVLAYQRIQEVARSNHLNIEFIGHPASLSVSSEYLNTLAGIMRSQQVARRGGYKILLVSPLYGGSLPVTDYVQRALKSLGHRCEVLDNTIFYPGLKHLQDISSNRAHRAQLQGLLTTLLAESVTARAMEMRADLVLGVAQAPFTPEVLQELRQAGILTAFWFIEDGELFPYWKAFAPHFDHYFAIQKGEFIEQLKAAGCRRPHYLPLAADPEIHRPLELTSEEMEKFGSDLSHVGAGYYNRRQLFPALLDYSFKLWGNDWEDSGALLNVLQRDGARLSTEETVKVFNASRININLHSSTYHEAVNAQGDFVNPRTFEVAACGAFQLVDERRLLAENFLVGEEVATFSDAPQLREKIDHYLASPHERIQMAEAARCRVLREHTYRHRMLELMGAISGSHPEWTPHAGGLPSAEEIIRESGAESELGKVMTRFMGRGPLTLEDVSQEIERGGGNLSETEAAILLLNEFRRWGLEKGAL